MINIQEYIFDLPTAEGLGEDSIICRNPKIKEFIIMDYENYGKVKVFEYHRDMDREIWYIILMFWLKSPYMQIANITERVIKCAHICGFIPEPEKKCLLKLPIGCRNINFQNPNMRTMALRYLYFQENLLHTSFSALQIAFHYNNVQLMTPPNEKNNNVNQRVCLQKHTIEIVIPKEMEIFKKIHAQKSRLIKEQKNIEENGIDFEKNEQKEIPQPKIEKEDGLYLDEQP